MRKVNVEILEVIHSKFAISPVKGELVYEDLKEKIETNDIVNIDFKGISNVTTAFLNRAIGNLYNDFDEKILSKKVRYQGLDELDNMLLKRVIAHALLTDDQKSNLNSKLEEAIYDEQND